MKNPTKESGAIQQNDNFLSVSSEVKIGILSESSTKEDNFSHYNSLTTYQRKCLLATNYWRERRGLQAIAVPDSDTHYYSYFKASASVFKGQITLNCIQPGIIQQEHEKPLKAHMPQFSFFKRPIKNTVPSRNIDLIDLYDLIINPKHYKSQTEQSYTLYKNGGKTQPYKTYKDSKFDYVTISGEFSKRSIANLVCHSGYYCFDVDNVVDAELLKQTVIAIEDRYFETEFCFISPSGCGIKWIVSIDSDDIHTNNFEGMKTYIKEIYKIDIDDTPDVSRACFVCYDPNCFINPKYLLK